MKRKKPLATVEAAQAKIYLVRGERVMIDRDIAELYGVETKRLNEQVKRNLDRFPGDFMFRLTKDEFENWRSQFATSNADRMGVRRPPRAFTEQGVAMLSSVLRSPAAVEVNVQIMRAFVKVRRLLASNDEIRKRLDDHDEKINLIFHAINKLTPPPETPVKKRIGFHGKGKNSPIH